MKTFYLKLLTIIAVLAGVYLSINTYHKYTQYKNFEIINERQSMIIQLPNAEYIEIISRNDHVTDYKKITEKPFNILTNIQKNSSLENSIMQTNSFYEYVQNEENSREVTITPIDSKNMDINITSTTAYQYKEGLKYVIQLDYTNKTNFKYDKQLNVVYFEDKGCKVEIYDPNLDYGTTTNKQTLLLRKDYTPSVEYNLKLTINCEE
jgi:citrate lyase gamma subunit